MRILLVSCYELGHQPLQVARPAALLHEEGFTVTALDLAVEDFAPARVAAADLIAISVPMHTALRIGSSLLERLRALDFTGPIVFYGMYAQLNASRLFAAGASHVIGGDPDLPLLGLAKAWRDGSPVPVGVSTPDLAGTPAFDRPDPLVPKRDILPGLDVYARLMDGATAWLAGYTEASSGCIHHCTHCPIPPVFAGRLLVRQRDMVLQDIAEQVRMGARHITFGDPDFFNSPRHSLSVVEAMHAAHPGITFDATIKVEFIVKHATLIPCLAASGCRFIVTAAESRSDRILGILAKGHTAADLDTALAIVRDAGITLRPSLVAFTPWTTLEDYREVLAWVRREDLVGDLDPVQFTISLLVPPGSLLEEHPEFLPHRTTFDPARFTWDWDFPDPRMTELREQVRTTVERMTSEEGAIGSIFVAIERLAARAAGEDPGALEAPLTRPSPKLSESWYCCAEPTDAQMGTLLKVQAPLRDPASPGNRSGIGT